MASLPLIPWEPHVFPTEIQQELRRRSTIRGFQPIRNDTANWGNTDTIGVEDWMSYQGPMTAWVRVCSNGYGLESKRGKQFDKPGFIFYGGKDFYTGYGFAQIGDSMNSSIIGYTPKDVPHVISNDFLNSPYPINVPPPEVEKISANIQKEILRRVKIDWTCFSAEQLAYMTPYLLVPGISVIVEWGWNHFDPLSLLDLKDDTKLRELYMNPYPLYTKNVLGSKGNYEVVFGNITNFEWSIDGNKIRAMTEITTKDRLWAGQAINLNLSQNDDVFVIADKQAPLQVLDSLKTFVDNYLDQFKNFTDTGDKKGDEIIDGMSGKNETANFIRSVYSSKINTNMAGLIDYIKKAHPENYKSYLFGVFTGRDTETIYRNTSIGGFGYGNQQTTGSKKVVTDTGANVEEDFDCLTNDNLWLNMGLVVEMFNYHSSQILGPKQTELFKVDIEDCIISGHPNLISADGNILLIPNAMAPKIHSGAYGAIGQQLDKGPGESDARLRDFFWFIPETSSAGMQNKANEEAEIEKFNKSKNDYNVMKTATMECPNVSYKELKEERTQVDLKFANYRLRRVGNQVDKILRDDLSILINSNRIKHSPQDDEFEFPFSRTHTDTTDKKPRKYERFFTGYLKNIYIHAKALKNLFNNSSIVTYDHLYTALFSLMNDASGNFWRLHITGATGRQGTTGLATMKIVDDNLAQYTSNEGDIFTFDYYAADGLLQSINFRPMLSNAQAMRTMYTQTNVDTKRPVVMSESNQLLDYKFRDRLMMDEGRQGPTTHTTFATDSFRESMRKLQAPKPLDGSFQITTKVDGKPLIRRLALPKGFSDVLTLLLDDQDQNFNPRYCGIMPNIQAEFQIQGIAGIRTFAMFRVRGLPEPYSDENIVFRVINVNDVVQGGTWTTSIVAGVLPLRKYFRSKLGLPLKEGPSDINS